MLLGIGSQAQDMIPGLANRHFSTPRESHSAYLTKRKWSTDIVDKVEKIRLMTTGWILYGRWLIEGIILLHDKTFFNDCYPRCLCL